MSSASTQFRANENGSLYNSIKNRDSAIGGRGNPFLYVSEQNFAPSCKTKIEVSAQNTAGYDRTIKYELPNYGLLNKLYLKVEFGAHTGTATSAKTTQLRQLPVPFSEVRIVYQGSTIARMSDRYIVARLHTETEGKRLEYLNEMLINVPPKASSFAAAGNHDRDHATADARAQGSQFMYVPLPFWFSESLSRNLDLEVLSDKVYLEVDSRSTGDLWCQTDTVTGPGTLSASLICYMNELHADERRAFNAVTYKPAGVPLTQLALSTTTHIESNVAYGSSGAIKLNSFSGQVQRLYIWAYVKSLEDAAGVTKNIWKMMPFDKLVLKSSGTEIYKMEHLRDHDEKYLEWFNQNTPFVPAKGALSGASREDRADNTGSIFWENLYCINFKEGWGNRGSADGSLNFGALSIPELEYTLSTAGTAATLDKSGLHNAGNVNICIASEQLNLVSYITNANGSTHIRSLTE